MARTVLGRGLSSLIPGKETGSSFKHADIKSICPNPKQPRDLKKDESYRQLVQSIETFGVLQPLIVKKKDGREDYLEDNFEIIAGERRYRAGLEAGLKKLPVVIKDTRNEIEGFEIALIENIQRQDLNPLEEARAFKYLLDDCEISQEELSKRIGKSRSYIANSVRLLNLEEKVKQLIADGALGASHARTLVTLASVKQVTLAKKTIEHGMSVRQLENIVGEDSSRKDKRKTTPFDNNEALEQELEKVLGVKIKVKSRSGSGKIEIFFAGSKELDDIKRKIIK